MTRRALSALFVFAALPLVAAEIPRPSPDFTYVLPEGSQRKLSEHKGKVVVVEFLLVTCPHCQNTARTLTKLQKEYGPRGLQVVGISIDPTADVSQFASQYGGSYPIGKAPDRTSVYSFLQHSVMNPSFYVPQIVLIDRQGVIQGQWGGTDPFLQKEEENLRAVIEKYLTAGGAAKKAAPAKAPRKSS